MLCEKVQRVFERALVAFVALAFFAVIAQAQTQRRVEKPSSKGPTGATLSFNKLAEDASKFNMVASDGEETVVTITFTLEQLKLVQAIMSEARAFALTEEGASGTDATTTRFSDDEVAGLTVDVMKFGVQSSLFVTITSDNGEITAEAGLIDRTNKKQSGPFFDILSRIDTATGKGRGPSAQ
jgi:hypothetical protein